MQRLRTRTQFKAVLAGELVSTFGHFALHRLDLDRPNADESRQFASHRIWVGAMVPKRWAKRAVTRNAIKRQMYLTGLALARDCLGAAFLIRLRREFSRKDFVSASSEALKQAVRTELQALLKGYLARPA